MNITAEEYTIFMLYGGTIFKFLSFFLYLILVLDICMRIKNINCHNIIPFFFFFTKLRKFISYFRKVCTIGFNESSFQLCKYGIRIFSSSR